ncbi:hypothetical protein SOPP22_16255 [Shewanella sp. OPT22]|nr:hypothetical protein SOPP22_16255 [Shewanella sp. OPT22]
MTKPKSIISILVILLVALTIFAYNLNLRSITDAHQNDKLSSQVKELTLELERYKNQLVILNSEINSNKKQLSELKGKLTKSSNEIKFNVNEQDNAFVNSKLTTPQSNADIKDSAALLSIIKRIQNGEKLESIQATTHDNFTGEVVDSDWAYDYETNIRNFIAADTDNSFDLQSVTCKSTACEVKIFANKGSAMQVGTLFAERISQQEWRDNEATLIFNHEVIDGIMSIMVSRY